MTTTTTMSDPGRICLACNRQHGVGGYNPIHPPRYADDDPRTAQRASEGPAVVPFPFDPVLRQALLMRGVITLEDLTVAEGMIRATTGQLLTEVNHEDEDLAQLPDCRGAGVARR